MVVAAAITTEMVGEWEGLDQSEELVVVAN